MLLYMCPRTSLLTTYVRTGGQERAQAAGRAADSATTKYVCADYYMCPHRLHLLYMCPHRTPPTIYVSS